MRKSLALFFGLTLASAAVAAPSEQTVNSVSQLRSTGWASAPVLNLLSYYDGQGQGGGKFKLGASCTHTVNGDIASGSPLISNMSSSVYIGEKINTAVIFPTNTTITGISFNRVLSAGTWTGSSTTISNIPDTTNIKVGMIANSIRIANGAKVTAITAPSTVINTTGTLNNGNTIVVANPSGITAGMFVTMTANTDTLPKVLPESAFAPGLITVSTIVSSTVHFTGSLGIAGVTGTNAAALRFTNGGSVTLSAATTGAESGETSLIFYQKNATASANANSTASQSAIALNGDNGGIQIVDGAQNCYARETDFTDDLGWGAKPDGTSDSTSALQNAITWAGQSTQPGPSGSLNFAPAVGIVKASSLLILKPVPFTGQGWNSAILQQTDGQAALTPLLHFFPLYDQTNRFSTFADLQFGLNGVTLRGPTDSASTIMVYADGYNGNVNIPDTPKATLYMSNLLVDEFSGFGIYTARASGIFANGSGRIQIRGSGAATGTNDCLHSDGTLTWIFEKLVVSGCDYGMYLQSPYSWTIFSGVDFTNNHGAMFTGSLSNTPNNDAINIYDFQYGNNLMNNMIVDTSGMKVNCIGCWVQDSGTFNPPAGVYSDIEITANAAQNPSTTPVLQLVNNYFTEVNSENAAFFHLNNITFDTGTTGVVSIDAATTTSSPTNTFSTNLATCSCTGKVIGMTNMANVYPTFLGLNQSVSTTIPTPPAGTVLQLQSADGTSTTEELYSFGTGSPSVVAKAAAGTAASPTGVLSGAILGSFVARPYNGVGYTPTSTARAEPVALENMDATHQGTGWEWDCTAKATTTRGICGLLNMGGISAPQITAPVATGTGTPTLGSRSSDTAGEVTGGTSATSIVITWAYPKTNKPFCVVSSPRATPYTSYVESATALTINLSATTGAVYDYDCWQN